MRAVASRAGAQAEIAALHLVALRHQHGALDGVVELADVAGPGVVEQQLHGRVVEAVEALAVALRVLRQEVTGQQRDVLAALAQRRHRDLDRVQPEEEVLPEAARRDLRVEVGVGGRDDAHVGAPRARAADALELAGLEHAQQLGLQVQRDVGDLVEEQRAAVGQLEAADAVALGVGEGALDVAEQLALEQALRTGRRRSP